jgi:hypothetical protein
LRRNREEYQCAGTLTAPRAVSIGVPVDPAVQGEDESYSDGGRRRRKAIE